ncbi:preATP grasp domain-containing protein [Acetivibrio cellulolyticus]|uniref:preATP grasp domain-containing protein n=1 Tax=Acetivibrio cellulolyticus TaxID=35830 RepID=UPI0001E2E2D5|nr:peptide ligase PGM1-related protein [Acetivibrio cellulolyticus]
MDKGFNLIEYITKRRDEGIIIWLLNIGAEKYWNKISAGVVDRSEDMIVNHTEEMNLLLCREQDIMILREQPDARYLNMLKELGFSVPRILTPSKGDPLTPISELVLNDEELQEQLRQAAESNEQVYFVPYAVTSLEEKIAENCGLKIIGAPSDVNAKVNDKVLNREIAEKLGLPVCKGMICTTVDEIREGFNVLTKEAPCFKRVIVKEPYGASGKGLYTVESEDKLNGILLRLSRFARSNKNAKFLIEGWYSKKADVNYQIYISPDGNVDVFSIKQQILNDIVYIGSKITPDLDREIIDQYNAYGQEIGKYLYSIGYTGVAGIDSIITEDNVIIPIIEINGRFTLSTYISFMQNILGEEKKLMSRYFRTITNSPVDYGEICRLFEKEGLLYTRENRSGVFVYTAATLPKERIDESGYLKGRLFLIIAADQWNELNDISERVEKIIQGITAKQ